MMLMMVSLVLVTHSELLTQIQVIWILTEIILLRGLKRKQKTFIQNLSLLEMVAQMPRFVERFSYLFEGENIIYTRLKKAESEPVSVLFSYLLHCLAIIIIILP